MEQHGNRQTFNIETVLRKNIVDSEYWRNTCAKLQTWEEVVDQIYYDVDHVEPWMSGNARGASSAFGLLYRLCQLVPTEDQVDALLRHKDSTYIRAVGFLYLRYVGEPRQLWSWLRYYVQDSEEFWPSGENGTAVTMGDYVRDVFLEQYYFETIFPRIPKPLHDEWLGSLRGMGLPVKAVGNGGQGGADRRGLDEPNRRPASVKASLSVAFGQRAPNRATAREEGRGLGAGMKNVYNSAREERPRSSSRDTRASRDPGAGPAAARPSRDMQNRESDQQRGSRQDRSGASGRDREAQSSGRSDFDRYRGSRPNDSHRGSGHDRSRHDGRQDRHSSRRRSRSPYEHPRSGSDRQQHVSLPHTDQNGASAKLAKLKAAYGSSPGRQDRREPSKFGAEEVYHTGSYHSKR